MGYLISCINIFLHLICQKWRLDNFQGELGVKTPPLTLGVTQTNMNSPTPMIPRGWVATGLRAPDLWVNVTLPVSTAGQDIYLFWLATCVCEVLRTHACTYTWPHTRTHARTHTHTHTHTHTLTASGLQTGLPQSSLSSCDCQKETAILWKAQSKFILYLLERLLHFTVHLSLRLEQHLCALQRRQTLSIKALFLEPSSLTVETGVWWNSRCELRFAAVARWCS